jgi:serine/threonine protein kinase
LGYLGAGGCFHAYRVARHEEDSQEYVAKVLRFPELLEQARWAFNVLNVLDHPNIIRAFDVRTAPESSSHLLEKYVPGKSCRDIIAQGRTAAPDGSFAGEGAGATFFMLYGWAEGP